MSTNEQTPGLIAAHAGYVKGAAVEQIGNLTGSAAWTSSGADQKQAGINDMKAAGEARKQDPAAHGYGKPEEIAGRLAGCEGMEEEGAASKKQ